MRRRPDRGHRVGGWRIIRTIGRRIYRIQPIDGLTSQAASAAVILGGSFAGAPISTTQVVASSVVGVGLGAADGATCTGPSSGR